MELVSILLKFVVEQLAQLDIVQSVEQIPFSISRLLFLANSKSDISLEKELFENYLYETKKFLDEEYDQVQDQIKTQEALRKMTKLPDTPADQPNLSQLARQQAINAQISMNTSSAVHLNTSAEETIKGLKVPAAIHQ